MSKRIITQEFIKEILCYDQHTGIFKWKNPVTNAVKKGSVAGFISTNGYWQISVHNKKRPAHRLAWLYMTGEWEAELDHINGIRTDNRIDNLRPVTRSENMRNMKLRKDNSSGITGVYFCNTENKWMAVLWIEGKRMVLGRCKTAIEAIDLRKAGNIKYGFTQR